jgi:glycosyltransferase involved in cell wall biosynthesis
MRIAVNALSAQPGGGMTFLRQLLQSLLSIDRLNRYLILSTEEQLSALGVSSHGNENVEILICPPRSWIRRGIWEQTAMLRLLTQRRVDVLYSPGNLGPLVSSIPSVVVVQTVDPLLREYQGTPLAFQFKQWVLRGMMRISTVQAHRVIAVSEYVQKLLVAQFCLTPSSIEVIHHGSPTLQHSPTGKEDSATLDPGSYLLAVSNIRYNKNYLRLLEAIQLLSEMTTEPVKLLIAGRVEHRACFAELQRFIAVHSLDSVQFLGGVRPDKLAILYRNALGLVFPSQLESFGLPVLEAMAYGIPVVASSIDPVKEICSDAILYFDPFQPAQMAEQMKRILEDRALRDELAQKGSRRASLFCWKDAAERTLRLLKAAGASNPQKMTGGVRS